MSLHKGSYAQTISFTTIADGSATAYGSESIFGLLYAIKANTGTLANTADLTITNDGGELSGPLLTITNLATSAIYYPRGDTCTAAGAATAGSNDAYPILDGKIKIVVAQGGDTKTGSITVYWMDMQ